MGIGDWGLGLGIGDWGFGVSAVADVGTWWCA